MLIHFLEYLFMKIVYSNTSYGTNWNRDCDRWLKSFHHGIRETLQSTAACQSSISSTGCYETPYESKDDKNTNIGTTDRQIKLLLEKRKRFKRNVGCPEYAARIHARRFHVSTIAINYPKPILAGVIITGCRASLHERWWTEDGDLPVPPDLYATVLRLESITSWYL